MNDPSKKSPRTFQCKDALWETFEQMSAELDCSVDYLINEAMKTYSRQATLGERLAAPPRSSGRGPVPAPPTGTALPKPPMVPPIPSSRAVPPPPVPHVPGAPPLVPVPSGSAGIPSVPSSVGMPAGQPPASRRVSAVPPPPMPSRQIPPGPPPAIPAPPSRGLPPPPPPKRPSAPISVHRPTAPPAFVPQPPGVSQPFPQPSQAFPLPQQPYSVPQPPPVVSSAMRQLTVWYRNQAFPITKDRFIIGRGKQSSDLTIKDPNVSRQHAMVEFVNGQYYIVDMGSTNGIEYNGQRIARKLIADNDSYRICDHDLRFSFR